MSKIDVLKNVPEISFIDDKTLSETEFEMLTDYIERYKELTGETADIPQADPVRLLIQAAALQVHQAMQYIDRAGKANLLKYSNGPDLDNLAALKRIIRKDATCAQVKIKFTVSAARAGATAIPGGTRVRTEDKVYFVVDEYAELAPGELDIEVSATAMLPGISGNGYEPGTITTIVDPIPYIKAAENTTTSAGGSDVEDDDTLTERVYLAPAGYSVAGPREAYEYWVKFFRSDISDVKVYTPAPTCVTVLIMLDGGVMPDQQTLNDLAIYLHDGKIRPLTDNVTVTAPDEINYNIELTYYINRSDASQAVAIQTAVTAAIEEYKLWQRHIGRDVNPSRLIRNIVAAGAKRVALTNPTHHVVDEYIIPHLGTENVTYGGLEDD